MMAVGQHTDGDRGNAGGGVGRLHQVPPNHRAHSSVIATTKGADSVIPETRLSDSMGCSFHGFSHEVRKRRILRPLAADAKFSPSQPTLAGAGSGNSGSYHQFLTSRP